MSAKGMAMVETLERILPYEKLEDVELRNKLAESYRTALPYPHVVADNFFSEDILKRIVDEFPSSDRFGINFKNQREVKRATGSEYEIPPYARAFIHALNSGPFINFLESVTGIKGLIPDPHLVGGGFHELPRGGKLGIHTDFNYHKKLQLDRRVNVLVYLNEDWTEEYGGHFEAWVPGGKSAEARYLPLFNRLVIFGTNDFTFHGNPEPVACPEGRTRKSIAMYYYTNGRPEEEWSGLVQTTVFMNRPGEHIVDKEPKWLKFMRFMPKFARVWFTRNIYEKHLSGK